MDSTETTLIRWPVGKLYGLDSSQTTSCDLIWHRQTMGGGGGSRKRWFVSGRTRGVLGNRNDSTQSERKNHHYFGTRKNTPCVAGLRPQQRKHRVRFPRSKLSASRAYTAQERLVNIRPRSHRPICGASKPTSEAPDPCYLVKI